MPPIGKYQSINLELYKTRATKWVIKSDKSDGLRMRKFTKDNSPSPSSYLVMKSFDNSQSTKVDKHHTMNKATKKCFIDNIVKQYLHVPGAGHYKMVEAAYDKIHSPTLKSKRH